MNPVSVEVPNLKQEVKMSPFAKDIYRQKYAWKDDAGNVVEEWPDTAKRVVTHVLGTLGYTQDDTEFKTLVQLITDRKFLPGGRYLYAAGRGLHQTNNCLLLRADDSREGWAELLSKSAMALQTGAGIGIDYSEVRPSGSPIKKTGGTASGPLSLMQMINEVGRHVMQGGSRRSAIWAGLNWKHEDCEQFITSKNWSEDIKKIKETDFNFPAMLDMTNISVLFDTEFFLAYADETHKDYEQAHRIYDLSVKQMVATAEPGLSVDIKDNEGETLRNAPVTGGTHVLTGEGYKTVEELVGTPMSVWTGRRWAEDVVFERTQEEAPIKKVAMSGGREIRCEPNHEFLVEDWIGGGKRKRFDAIRRVPAKDLKTGDKLHISLPFGSDTEMDNDAYTMGYIYGDGSFNKSGGADLTLCTEESKACLPLLVGANSVNKNDGRGYTRLYFSVDEKYSGLHKASVAADVFASSDDYIKSFVAGLFDADGNWEPTQKAIRLASKHHSFLCDVRRLLEQVGILSHVTKAGHSTYGKSQMWQLVIASEFAQDFAEDIPTQRLQPEVKDYKPYRPSCVKVISVEDDGFEDVYCADVGVAEHSFMAEGVIISNCCELTSRDTDDICNLGSINLANIKDPEELALVVKYATLFLLAGTIYSDIPYEDVRKVRAKNRRLGLGLMGVHEWLLKRGYAYEPNEELAKWLEVYATSGDHASQWARQHDLSVPVKTRAIAPNGTIGIIAETTTGIEPIFCTAFKRRYLEAGDTWKFQYVVDPTARRLVEEEGIEPQAIEDSYSLAYNVEKRIAFQAFVQRYVDHAISSTVNLPYPIEDELEVDLFKNMLFSHLSDLRGVTCYPNGARGGQPLTPATYEEAVAQEGVVFEEDESRCKGGQCGT